jgi:hypothetical protein
MDMEFLYMKNERLIGFRTTADLAARIAALAEHECLSISDIARRATIQTVREFEAQTAMQSAGASA